MVANGLLYGMLTDADLYESFFDTMLVTTRDGYSHLIKQMLTFTGPLLIKMQNNSRSALLKLVAEMVEREAMRSEKLLLSLIKNISSESDLKLADFIYSQVEVRRKWLQKYPVLLQTVVAAATLLLKKFCKI